MRIERTNDIQEIMQCLPFEREIRKKGRDNTRESDMLLFIQSQLNNPMFGFWIGYDEKNVIIGYVVAMISLFPGMERLQLLRIYAKQKDLFNEFEEVLKQWAKQFKVRICQMTVSSVKHVKVYQRKFGYKIVSINMERRYF